MGRISAIYRRHGASSQSTEFAAAPDRVCGYGALADMGGGHFNRVGDLPVPQAVHADVGRYLAKLLTCLHDNPEELASRLLHRFGSVGRIVHASDAELRQVAMPDDKWVDTFLGVRQLLNDGMRETLFRTQLGKDKRALAAHLWLTMRNLSEERMLGVFADADGFIIAEEVLAEGSEAHVQLTPRKIFGRALKLDARRILLAHNHPSGSSKPSKLDVEHTRLLCRQAKDLGLCIEDHLIVGAKDVTSLKDVGFI